MLGRAPDRGTGRNRAMLEQRFLGHISGIRLTDHRGRGTIYLVYPRAYEYLEGRRHAGGVSLARRHRCVHSSIDPRPTRFVRSGRDHFDPGASAHEAMITLKTATSPVRCPAETTADLRVMGQTLGLPERSLPCLQAPLRSCIGRFVSPLVPA